MLLNPKNFKCKLCGDCCKIVVKLTKEEINKIKNKGYKDFLEKDPIKGNGYALKRINGNCVFLKDNKCEIYEIRPEICRAYPFLNKTNKLLPASLKMCFLSIRIKQHNLNNLSEFQN